MKNSDEVIITFTTLIFRKVLWKNTSEVILDKVACWQFKLNKIKIIFIVKFIIPSYIYERIDDLVEYKDGSKRKTQLFFSVNIISTHKF